MVYLPCARMKYAEAFRRAAAIMCTCKDWSLSVWIQGDTDGAIVKEAVTEAVEEARMVMPFVPARLEALRSGVTLTRHIRIKGESSQEIPEQESQPEGVVPPVRLVGTGARKPRADRAMAPSADEPPRTRAGNSADAQAALEAEAASHDKAASKAQKARAAATRTAVAEGRQAKRPKKDGDKAAKSSQRPPAGASPAPQPEEAEDDE